MTRYSMNGKQVDGVTFTAGCLLLTALFFGMVGLLGGVLALLVNVVFGAGTFSFAQGLAAVVLIWFVGCLLGRYPSAS